MALRASRPAAPQAAQQAAPQQQAQQLQATPAPQAAASVTPAPQAAASVTPAPQAVASATAPAPAPAPQGVPAPPVVSSSSPMPPATSSNTPSVADLNAGVLENVEGIGVIGNYVTVDGSEFLYKSSGKRVSYLDVNIHYGKRFYQWVDESNPNAKVYHNSDTKLDDRYKLKMEIRWYEQGDDGEPVEYIMSLSTTSAIQFLNYVKALAKAGLGVGQVWTRMTISRHNRPNSSERYSRVDFEAYSLETGEPLGIKSSN